ncbi:hypothetical protein, partial [uncultured Lamprocystis sp.]|uniref:hypothetical protein n=1 Tax=uncultured Lamprocystis sp. TaxID=543132 RepID=UPI0025DEACD1
AATTGGRNYDQGLFVCLRRAPTDGLTYDVGFLFRNFGNPCYRSVDTKNEPDKPFTQVRFKQHKISH